MALAKSTAYFLVFVAIVIALSLLIGTQQTGFFTVNNSLGTGENTSDLKFEQGLNQSEKEFEIGCGGIPPVIHWVNATPNPASIGQVINFTAKVTDNYLLSKVLIEINGVNYTMKKCISGCEHWVWGGDSDPGFRVSEFGINCYYDEQEHCWVEQDMWCYSWNATSSGNYNYTVCAEDWMGLWACKKGNFTVLPSGLAIALSTTLSNGVDWNVTNLPAYNLSANGNNGSGITNYYVIVQAIGLNADLYVKANGNLLSNSSYIPLANEKLSFNITNSTVPSFVKKSLTTNYSDNRIGFNLANSSKSWLKFFLDVPIGQAAGTYNNTLMFKVVQTGNLP